MTYGPHRQGWTTSSTSRPPLTDQSLNREGSRLLVRCCHDPRGSSGALDRRSAKMLASQARGGRIVREAARRSPPDLHIGTKQADARRRDARDARTASRETSRREYYAYETLNTLESTSEVLAACGAVVTGWAGRDEEPAAELEKPYFLRVGSGTSPQSLLAGAVAAVRDSLWARSAKRSERPPAPSTGRTAARACGVDDEGPTDSVVPFRRHPTLRHHGVAYSSFRSSSSLPVGARQFSLEELGDPVRVLGHLVFGESRTR